jgi:hypothetical protein
MQPARRCIIESLESRQLFSSIAPTVVLPAAKAHSAISVEAVGTGVTLQLQAGVAFTGEVAFIPTPVSGLAPSANIDWGDGTTTSGTAEATTQGGVAGYDIIGSHTYAGPGTFSIDTTMVLRPISQPGQPTPQFIVVLNPVISTAVVAPASVGASTTEVTIQEVAGKHFTADLGSFSTAAPATHLQATIHWGDGKSSRGILIAADTPGSDQATVKVSGAHKYTRAGTFDITIYVIRPPVGASLAIQDIATLGAIADVAAKSAK